MTTPWWGPRRGEPVRRRARRSGATLAALVVLGLGGSACSGSFGSGAETPPATAIQGTTTEGTPSSDSPTAGAGTETRDVLAPLLIDDGADAGRSYDRDDWPTWADLDDDGCDTRQQVLIEQSLTPAQVDPARCTVVAGDWVSIYDGMTTEQPGDLDIDHVVALEEAHESGGWQWTPEQRRSFANDPANLVAVSASSNRSKGSRPPQEWRPTDRSSWCEFARIRVDVKVRYRLTATTPERDALGEMLDTCG